MNIRMSGHASTGKTMNYQQAEKTMQERLRDMLSHKREQLHNTLSRHDERPRLVLHLQRDICALESLVSYYVHGVK